MIKKILANIKDRNDSEYSCTYYEDNTFTETYSHDDDPLIGEWKIVDSQVFFRTTNRDSRSEWSEDPLSEELISTIMNNVNRILLEEEC